MNLDWSPLWLSLKVAALSTACAALLGLYAAYWLARRDFRGRDLPDALVTLPLVLPPTVLGYYLLVVLGRESSLGRVYESLAGQPLVFTWQAAVVAAFVHPAPLLIKSASAALESVDPSLNGPLAASALPNGACFGGSRSRWPPARSSPPPPSPSPARSATSGSRS